MVYIFARFVLNFQPLQYTLSLLSIIFDMYRIFFVFGFILFAFSLSAQLNGEEKIALAQRASSKIKLDGILSEADWGSAPIISGFYQRSPEPGASASQRSEVKLLFDDEAIYIGAYLQDDLDSMSFVMTERDVLSNADWFGIILCPYKDGINGVGFILTSQGVQLDTKYSSNGEDIGWDAVWDGNVSIGNDGWYVEMKIPYAALRFPETEEQEWGVNFARNFARFQESSFWYHIDQNVPGFLNQAGTLVGLKNIKPPIRLSATPFIAGYLENYNDKAADDPQSSTGRSFNAGMDIKYGLSDAFTLDMTLIPDFGEALSDNQVINLSPFEVQFDENRQFFTEGTELFSKGDLFYSRRAGGSPFYYADNLIDDSETILSEPLNNQLINATKISGRTTKGTGLGFFNAIESKTYATVKDSNNIKREVLINPLTNYNVLVADQNLKNNSYISLINTNVTRLGEAYDANATALVFELRDKKQNFGIEGVAKMSQLLFENNQSYNDYVSEIDFLRAEDKSDLTQSSIDKNLEGYSYGLSVAKISGKFNASVSYEMVTHTFEINDLGFQRSPNSQEFDVDLSYNIFTPFGKWNRMSGGVSVGQERLYRPNVYSNNRYNIWWEAQTKKFRNINLFSTMVPQGRLDYFEPRTPGKFLRKTSFGYYGFFASTDRRKKSTLYINGGHGWSWDLHKASYTEGSIGTTLTASDRLSFDISMYGNYDAGDLGYVDEVEDDIIIGLRNRRTLINNVSTVYTFNKNMTLNARLRHYWSSVEYYEFRKLIDEGLTAPSDYNEFNDLSLNFFNIDLVYRWRFAPGSDIFFIWKNSINDVGEEFSDIQYRYGRGVGRLGQASQRNSISVKLIYFVDYATLRK